MSTIRIKNLAIFAMALLWVGCGSDDEGSGDKSFGQTCTDASECASGICGTVAPLNYCLVECSNETICPIGSTCQASADGVEYCVLDMPTRRAFGVECTDGSQCQSNLCAADVGYCVQECDEMTACPNNAECTNGFCIRSAGPAAGAANRSDDAQNSMDTTTNNSGDTNGASTGGRMGPSDDDTLNMPRGGETVPPMSDPMDGMSVTGDPDVDACRALSACINSCGTDAMCQQACRNGTSPEALRRYETIFTCLQANSCVNQLTQDIDQTCLNENCSAELEACFGPPVVPMGDNTCLQLTRCFGTCAPADIAPVANQACRDRCIERSSQEGFDLYSLYLDCMRSNCQAEEFSADCQLRECNAEATACEEDGLVFGNGACGSILDEYFECNNGRCQNMVLEQVDREGRRLMNEILDCVGRTQRCGAAPRMAPTVADCEAPGVCDVEITACRTDEAPMGGMTSMGGMIGGSESGGMSAEDMAGSNMIGGAGGDMSGGMSGDDTAGNDMVGGMVGGTDSGGMSGGAMNGATGGMGGSTGGEAGGETGAGGAGGDVSGAPAGGSIIPILGGTRGEVGGQTDTGGTGGSTGGTGGSEVGGAAAGESGPGGSVSGPGGSEVGGAAAGESGPGGSEGGGAAAGESGPGGSVSGPGGNVSGDMGGASMGGSIIPVMGGMGAAGQPAAGQNAPSAGQSAPSAGEAAPSAGEAAPGAG
ncbi:MAG: hypothetical protein VX589_10280 [Myxococcota bacterium]|nr:hypothetical protein [Myxococcota bacterium]